MLTTAKLFCVRSVCRPIALRWHASNSSNRSIPSSFTRQQSQHTHAQSDIRCDLLAHMCVFVFVCISANGPTMRIISWSSWFISTVRRTGRVWRLTCPCARLSSACTDGPRAWTRAFELADGRPKSSCDCDSRRRPMKSARRRRATARATPRGPKYSCICLAAPT